MEARLPDLERGLKKKKNAVKLLEDKEMGTLLHNLSKRNLDILSTGFVLWCKKNPIHTHMHKKWQEGWKEGINAISF